jgi:hypothetical protein
VYVQEQPKQRGRTQRPGARRPVATRLSLVGGGRPGQEGSRTTGGLLGPLPRHVPALKQSDSCLRRLRVNRKCARALADITLRLTRIWQCC